MNEQPIILNKIKIDLIVIGNPNSGKTSLIRRFIDGQQSFSHFYNPTLGLSLEKKIIQINDNEVTACIWDTAGQQKFFSLTKNYFKKADGVLVVFDLTDKNSFERIQRFWINEIKQKSDQDCSQILIGNKVDMEQDRIIDNTTIKQLSSKLNIKYFETSAKTGKNVNESIQYLIKQCLNKIKDNQPRGIEININQNKNNNNNKSSNCFTSTKELFVQLFDKIKGK